MPKKISLREFLRQEILRKRIRTNVGTYDDVAPSATSIGTLTQEDEKHQPIDFDSLFDEPVTVASGEQSKKIGELDSIYGEPIQPSITKEEVLQTRLQQLLAHSASDNVQISPPALQNSVLDAMKSELQSLVSLEEEAQVSEMESVRRRKKALLQEIGGAEREAAERQRRAKLGANLNDFPLPIEITQKKRLQRAAKREAKSTSSPEKPRQKRSREEIKEEQEFDGEDRLRSLGNLKKPRSMRLTGHWQSAIHNYFPAIDASGDGDDIFKGLTVEKKMATRKELIEYGSKAAEVERKRRRLGDRGGWGEI